LTPNYKEYHEIPDEVFWKKKEPPSKLKIEVEDEDQDQQENVKQILSPKE
jgi:hypothetical protein